MTKFSVVRDVFYQIYNIHGVTKNTLTRSAAQKDSRQVQKKFRLLKAIKIDFKAAIRNAIGKTEPGAEVHFFT